MLLNRFVIININDPMDRRVHYELIVLEYILVLRMLL